MAIAAVGNALPAQGSAQQLQLNKQASVKNSDQFKAQLAAESKKNPNFVKNSSETLTDVKSGTDLALKKVAEEFEQQIYAMMWQKVLDSAEVSFGEPSSSVDPVKLLGPELIADMVKAGMDPEEFGDLAKSIYDDFISEKSE